MSNNCTITSLKDGQVMFTAKRNKNIYVADLGSCNPKDLICLRVQEDIIELWHKRLGRVNCSLLNQLDSKDLVREMPKLKFTGSKVWETCVKGKQNMFSFKLRKQVSTSRPLQLPHMDLCGPIKGTSRGGKNYILVIVYDYSRFPQIMFVIFKEKTFLVFKAFTIQVQVKYNNKIVGIRSDHETEFENAKFNQFHNEHRINHNFSTYIIPQ